jgi:transcriptional regulator with XRE-family HTH domain
MIVNMDGLFSYGDILKRARISTGKTQMEIAQQYGVEERTLRRWENKEFNPRVSDFFGLPALYGVRVDIELD